jgi:DNA-binding CsgD family transcriptional regulator
MGTKPDHEVAALAGTSASIVGRYRRKLGIRAYEGYKFGVRPVDGATEGEERAPGRGRQRRTRGPDKAQRKSRIGPYAHLVGKRSDREVAEMAGVTQEAVRMYRRRRRIRMLAPGEVGPETSVRQARKRRTRLAPFADLLGRLPDAEVAARAGVTAENVRSYRRRHNIPASWREAPSPAPRANTGLQAWAVLVRDESPEHILFAHNLAAATEAATTALGADRVLGVRHIGPAIG